MKSILDSVYTALCVTTVLLCIFGALNAVVHAMADNKKTHNAEIANALMMQAKLGDVYGLPYITYLPQVDDILIQTGWYDFVHVAIPPDSIRYYAVHNLGPLPFDVPYVPDAEISGRAYCTDGFVTIAVIGYPVEYIASVVVHEATHMLYATARRGMCASQDDAIGMQKLFVRDLNSRYHWNDRKHTEGYLWGLRLAKLRYDQHHMNAKLIHSLLNIYSVINRDTGQMDSKNLSLLGGLTSTRRLTLRPVVPNIFDQSMRYRSILRISPMRGK